MTRINANIDVKLLTDKHLLAEHREIKRVPARYQGRLAKGDFSGIPDTFKLGGGHELFFINKGKFTFKRYIKLHQECLDRGFNVTNFMSSWNVYDDNLEHFNDWDATQTDNELVIERISQRLGEAKSALKYKGENVTLEFALNLLTQNDS